METYVPPILPPERAPDYVPDQQKPRRSFFELFKKQAEQTPISPEAKTPMVTEAAPERPSLKPERRKFAATVMSLLRGEAIAAPAPAYETGVGETEAVIELDPVTAPSRTETAPLAVEAPTAEAPQFIERAKEMGRGVLRLLGQVTQEIRHADEAEHFTTPTNLEPLAVADADIRAAMEELVAPIEAIQAPVATTEQAPDAVDSVVAMSGGDREFAFLNEAKSPFARTLEVAASVATIAAREALDVKEKVFTRTSTLRKFGLFAMGAATAGGFVYTWNRLRAIKKEQREMRRERKRFETEVRAIQEREEQRLHALEASNVQGMSQPERQHYVQEVSDFAHARAEEIRTTARMREVIQTPAAAPERARYEVPPLPEQPVILAEKAGIVERIGAAFTNAKDSAGAALGGAVAAGASLLQGQQSQPQSTQQQAPQQPIQHQQKPARAKTTQAWLWGMLLGVAIMVFIFLWALRIL